MSGARSKIDVLLNLVPDSPDSVLQQLEREPALASAQDAHGYSLLHAAASYSKIDFLHALVETHKVAVNIKDEDNETPLFYAETVEVAQALLDLGADPMHQNDEDQTAGEKMADEDEYPLVAAFLNTKTGHATGDATTADAQSSSEAELLSHPPPLPNGIQVNLGTMLEPEGEAADPELRRRIEELAAREDFHSEDGQRQLRELVEEAVLGLRNDAAADERESVRRRID